MKACPQCETLWDDGKRFCPYHGLPLLPAPEAVGPPLAAADAEPTVRMSEQERAQLFTPQFPASALAETSAAAGETPPPAPLVAEALSIEDPPTAKSFRNDAPAAELDLLIPPTIVVPPSALPPLAAPSLAPPAVVPPAEGGAPSQAQADAQSPAATVASVLADGGSPLTTAIPESDTSRLDPSATIVQLGQAAPADPPPLPPAASPDDDLGFILDLGEKSSARLPPPPEAATAPPPTCSPTPSAAPALVSPPSPTMKRLTAVQYFKLFNERKKAIQQFIQRLDPKKARVAEGHSNQEDHLMHRYDIAFRCLGAPRTFPLAIILQRKPVYELITSVDLYEIAEAPLLREERVKSLGGQSKSTPNGVIYHLSYDEHLPAEQFGDWLTATFQAIARLLPGASL